MKNILLGVTGSIAAYKSPEIVRNLRSEGFSVRVVLSESAKEFVTETTLQAVSSYPVRSSLWDAEAEAAMSHIELARWADCILIAPATANFLSQLSYGSANDLLTTLCLATRSKIFVSPAMNSVMWENKAVQENRATLVSRGINIIEPDYGDQACGEVGVGRMPNPDVIAGIIKENFSENPSPLQGKKVLITAGPTREPIDPIRFISNRSSGKMGYALASAFNAAGCNVRIISGPSSLPFPDACDVVKIETAQEMYHEVHKSLKDIDIFVSAAAVSDYSSEKVDEHKIKKNDQKMSLHLIKSPDILSSVTSLRSHPFCVGFAAETDNIEVYAKEKLIKKELDMIIANKVGSNLGFDSDENSVLVLWNGGSKRYKKQLKISLAKQLVQLISKRYMTNSEINKKPSNVSSIYQS
tara:strand:+ start:417 stop:1652 length:1236 start_codon:yes stop_codon:yes gene_type:complete